MNTFSSNSFSAAFDLDAYSTEGLVVIDREGKIIECNIAFTQLFGEKREDVLHSYLDSFLHSSSPYRANDILESSLNRFDILGVNQKQHLLPFSVKKTKTERDNYFVLNLLLIENTAETGNEIRDKEWESIVNYAPDIILTVNKDKHIEFINKGPFLDAERFTGANFSLLFEAEDKESIDQHFNTVFEAGEYTSFDAKDIYGHWYHCRLGPIKELGEVTGILIVASIITDKKTKQTHPKDTENQYKNLIEYLPFTITKISKDGNIIYSNKKSKKENLNNPIEDSYFNYLSDHEKKLLKQALEFVSKNMESSIYEVFHIENQAISWSETQLIPLITEGIYDTLLVLETDITEKKLASEKLKLKAEELQRSNHDLEQFAYIASHDLQEPLRAISSFTDLLLKKYDDVFDEKGKKYAGFILKGAERMRLLINDLLKFSRVQSHEGEMVDIICTELINDIKDDLKLIIAETKTEIQLEPIPNFKGDATLMKQLFQNLISNSIKFRSAQAPMITISCNESATEFIFKVEDNGIGIREKYQKSIFNVFEKLHPDNSYTGTGIGLAIVKKIVEWHSGKIWVESTEGEGTSFYFTIAKG